MAFLLLPDRKYYWQVSTWDGEDTQIRKFMSKKCSIEHWHVSGCPRMLLGQTIPGKIAKHSSMNMRSSKRLLGFLKTCKLQMKPKLVDRKYRGPPYYMLHTNYTPSAYKQKLWLQYIKDHLKD